VALFGSLFAARTDTYAVRWENDRTGRAGWLPAVRGGWRKGVPHAERDYLPLTGQVLAAHLSGQVHVGLYPLLDEDRCWWLAADFDGPPAAGHRAATRGDVAARADEPGQLRPAFPSQDILPAGGVGNLIAAPLYGKARRNGTTVFLDPSTLEPHEDIAGQARTRLHQPRFRRPPPPRARPQRRPVTRTSRSVTLAPRPSPPAKGRGSVRGGGVGPEAKADPRGFGRRCGGHWRGWRRWRKADAQGVAAEDGGPDCGRGAG
jgi:hypothetical protein